jgi:hypothetical protein
MFGGGGSMISTITSGISSVVSAVSTVASAAGSSLGSVASTVISGVGSALGIGGGAAAAAGGGGAAAALGGGAAAAAGGGAAAVGGGASGALLTGGAALGAGVLGALLAPKLVDMAGSAFIKFTDKLLGTGGPGLLEGIYLDKQKKQQEQIDPFYSFLDIIDAAQLAAKNQGIRLEDGNQSFIPAGVNPNEIRGKHRLINEKTGQKGPWRNLDKSGLFSWLDQTFDGIKGSGFNFSEGLSRSYDFYSAASMLPHAYMLYGDKMFGSFKYGAKGLGYDNGRLINNATVFGTNQGHMAVGGEMGTEAIMPLSRDSQGRLGVSMNGGGAGGVNINFTINAVDARGVDELLMSRKSLITNIVRSGVSDRGVKI